MKKSLIVLMLLVSVSLFPVFAAERDAVPSIDFGASFTSSDSGISVGSLSLEATETAYFNNNLFVKANAGLTMNILGEDDLQFGLSGLAVGGYSFKINNLLRIDVGAGVGLYESSALEYLIKTIANEEYTISTAVTPLVDASALFGLDAISLRAGFRAGWQIASGTLNSGLCFVPYVGISSVILNFLSIF